MPLTLLVFDYGLLQKLKRFYLIFAFLFVCINHSYGYDSLEMALSLHQAARYQKALPIFINLSEKFRIKRNSSYYALWEI